MEFVSKIVRKFAKTASVALTESVKQEVKTTAIHALPVLAGIGLVILGFKVFKSSSVPAVVTRSIPTLSTMSVVTNNFFFDGSVQSDILSKIANSFEGGR